MTTEPLVPLETIAAITGGDLDDDEVTRHALDAVTRQIRNYCRWHIAPSRTETITVDGPGGHVLALPTLHLTGIERITDAGTEVDDPEWSQTGDVRKSDGRRWTSKFRGITAEITHGHDEVPELATIVAELVAQTVNTPAGTAAVTEKMGPFTFDAAATGRSTRMAVGGAAFLQGHLAVLDHYRIHEPA